MAKEFAKGGYTGTGGGVPLSFVPSYIPPSGMCIRHPDGSHEWILPQSAVRELGLERLRELAKAKEESDG